MKISRTIFTGLLLLLFLPIHLAGQQWQDNIEWVSMERALELASDEEKLILIDVFAEWCPYCQRMQSEVYPDQQIEELIDLYFVPVRIDTESDRSEVYLGREFTQAEFARALRFQSVPTTFFMNSDGEVVGHQPGYLPEDVFAQLLEYVGSGAYEEISFDEFSNH